MSKENSCLIIQKGQVLTINYQSFNQNPINFTDPYGLQFRAGDTPYLTKKEEEEALKKIALSKEERERIKKAFSESEVGAFLESFFRGEGFKIGWESGYYECLSECMLKEWHIIPPAIFSKIGEELFTIIVEKGNRQIAGLYYWLKSPKRFKAFGKYSKKYVPNLASKLKIGAKYISGAGWAIFDIEISYCILECTKKTLLDNPKLEQGEQRISIK
jgi:hypothetical protein